MAANHQANGSGDLGRRVRRALGLTREEVAARARMDPSDLARVEHAPAAMTAGALIRLADGLDTTVSDLLGSIPEQPQGHGRAASHPLITELRGRERLRLIEPGGIGRLDQPGRVRARRPTDRRTRDFTVHHGDIIFRTVARTAIGRYGEGPVALDHTGPNHRPSGPRLVTSDK